jgi:hypothetical protein
MRRVQLYSRITLLHSFSAKLSMRCPVCHAKCARAEIAKLSMHSMEVLQALTMLFVVPLVVSQR